MPGLTQVGCLIFIQGTISPAIWVDYTEYSSAKAIWDALTMRFRKMGGAQTYLQMVNMITIQMTDSEDLLGRIQDFQENYMKPCQTATVYFLKTLSHSHFVQHFH